MSLIRQADHHCRRVDFTVSNLISQLVDSSVRRLFMLASWHVGDLTRQQDVHEAYHHHSTVRCYRSSRTGVKAPT